MQETSALLIKGHICPTQTTRKKQPNKNTEKRELMQEFPKGSKNIFIMGDLQEANITNFLPS